MRKGTLKKFREYLNKEYENQSKHKHNRYNQRVRGYGDYLYFQDREKFNVLLNRLWKESKNNV